MLCMVDQNNMSNTLVVRHRINKTILVQILRDAFIISYVIMSVIYQWNFSISSLWSKHESLFHTLTSHLCVFAQLQAIGGIPSKTYDLWEATGQRPEAKFTWDLTRNDNLEWPHKFRPRCRFDRLFMRDAQPRGLKPVYFELVGLERLDGCRRFCSDHWGLLAHLDKPWTYLRMYCLTLCVPDAAIFVVFSCTSVL